MEGYWNNYSSYNLQQNEVFNTYPIMGSLYIPTSLSADTFDVVVALMGTIEPEDTGATLELASKSFVNDMTSSLFIRDKIIFSVAYPQDKISKTMQYNLPNVGSEDPDFLVGDNLPYARAALQWVKTSLNSFLESKGVTKKTNKVYLLGHSQGAYLALRLNTLEDTDGIVMSAPGPLRLDLFCSLGQRYNPPGGSASCTKIYNLHGPAVEEDTTSEYFLRSGQNFTKGHRAPMLFVQANDDTTSSAQQANYLRSLIADIDKNDNPEVTSVFVPTGGHSAFLTNPTIKTAIRSFIDSSVAVSSTVTTVTRFTLVPSDGITVSFPVFNTLALQNGYRSIFTTTIAGVKVQTPGTPDYGVRDAGKYTYFGGSAPDSQNYTPYNTPEGNTAAQGKTGGGSTHGRYEGGILTNTLGSQGTGARSEWVYNPPVYCKTYTRLYRSDSPGAMSVAYRDVYRGGAAKYVSNYGSIYYQAPESVRNIIRKLG